MKRFIALILTAIMLAATLIPALAAEPSLDNFTLQREYKGQFADVRESDWFFSAVKLGYETGLLDGTSATAFAPRANLTVGQILALASRIHAIYNTGESSFVEGSPWYQVYVDYAQENGLMLPGLDSYTRPALRCEVAGILAGALPASALAPINTVEDDALPDVKIGDPYADEIYALYRAGVLTGNDAKGTFHPNNSIRRSDIAAIITRMALPDTREERTFIIPPEFYFAFFEGTAEMGRLLSISGVVVRFHGNVAEIKPDDFTEMVLKRDGVTFTNVLEYVGERFQFNWGNVEVTDFHFKFNKENLEPGRYSLSGRYRGEHFSVSDRIIEGPLGDTPANPDDLLEVGWGYYPDINDDPEEITSISLTFRGNQQQFLLEDLTDLKLTRNGTEIALSFGSEVYRYLTALDHGIETSFHIPFDFDGDGLTGSGTYRLTGSYRGTKFDSMEITIP